MQPRLLFVLSWVLACSGTVPGGTGGGPVAIENLEGEVGAATCGLFFRCLTPSDDAAAIRRFFGSPAACRARLAPMRNPDLGDLVGAVRAGAVRYDGAAARRCLDLLSTSCSPASGPVASICPSVFTGTVAAGGMCFRHEECAGDSYCDHGDPRARRCPGTCAPRLRLGARCGESAACSRAGLTGLPRCGPSEGPTTPDMQVCTEERELPAAGLGQPCGRARPSPALSTLTRCQDGLYCSSRSSMGVCRSPVAAGAECGRDNELCVDGYICLPVSPERRACVPLEIRTRAGESCTTEMRMAPPTGIALCNPLDRLTCTAGTCQLVGTGVRGSRCMRGDFSEFTCDPGLYCQRDTLTCQPVNPAGARCESSRECASGDCLDGTCAPRYCR